MKRDEIRRLGDEELMSLVQTTGPRGSVRAWVLGVVRNRAIDALRRDARPRARFCSAPRSADGRTAPGGTK